MLNGGNGGSMLMWRSNSRIPALHRLPSCISPRLRCEVGASSASAQWQWLDAGAERAGGGMHPWHAAAQAIAVSKATRMSGAYRRPGSGPDAKIAELRC